MALVSLQDISKTFGPQTVLEGVSLQIEDDERLGLIGANGTGKSTLLKITVGEIEPDGGVAQRKKGIAVSYVRQDPDFSAHGTLFEYVRTAFDDLQRIQNELQSLEADLHALPDGEEHNRVAHRVAELHDQFKLRGGYQYTSRIEEVLHGLGFPESCFHRTAAKLSGGERTRAAIAHAILSEPDLLLLDEPTNHLDMDATRWLESFLQKCRQAVIVVSHDRYLLDKVAKRIAELERAHVQVYKGNFTDYQLQKDEMLKARGRQYEQQQAFIAKEEEFIRRNLAGQRTKEAQGRRKRLERVERIENVTEAKTVGLEFQPEVRGGNEVLRLRNVTRSFGDRTLFHDLSLDISRGDRLGVIGPSGAGKTSLLRIILGQDKPDAGEVHLGHGIHVGYHAQHRVDLDPVASIIDEVHKVRPKAEMTALRGYLGRFLFSGDDIFKPTGNLSGGEQTRVALAKLILSGANCLVLDEPTNHLDIPSRAALEQALKEYEGTILIVSHDRYLLKNLATQILLIAGGEARKFAGDYSVYEARIAAEEALAKVRPKADTRPAVEGPHVERISKSEAKQMSFDEVERRIVQLEKELDSITSQMDDPFIYEVPEKAKVLQKAYRQARAELDKMNKVWEEMVEEGEC